jgi:hypothetical protein
MIKRNLIVCLIIERASDGIHSACYQKTLGEGYFIDGRLDHFEPIVHVVLDN